MIAKQRVVNFEYNQNQLYYFDYLTSLRIIYSQIVNDTTIFIYRFDDHFNYTQSRFQLNGWCYYSQLSFHKRYNENCLLLSYLNILEQTLNFILLDLMNQEVTRHFTYKYNECILYNYIEMNLIQMYNFEGGIFQFLNFNNLFEQSQHVFTSGVNRYQIQQSSYDNNLLQLTFNDHAKRYYQLPLTTNSQQIQIRKSSSIILKNTNRTFEPILQQMPLRITSHNFRQNGRTEVVFPDSDWRFKFKMNKDIMITENNDSDFVALTLKTKIQKIVRKIHVDTIDQMQKFRLICTNHMRQPILYDIRSANVIQLDQYHEYAFFDLNRMIEQIKDDNILVIYDFEED